MKTKRKKDAEAERDELKALAKQLADLCALFGEWVNAEVATGDRPIDECCRWVAEAEAITTAARKVGLL